MVEDAYRMGGGIDWDQLEREAKGENLRLVSRIKEKTNLYANYYSAKFQETNIFEIAQNKTLIKFFLIKSGTSQNEIIYDSL